MSITPQYIAEALSLDDPVYDPDVDLTRVIIDSRTLTLPESTLFIALRTPNNDGHKYIADLQKKGVRNFIVDNIPENVSRDKTNFFLVDDTLEALRCLGAKKRLDSKAYVIAVTGSKGKTITKEMIYQLIRDKLNVVRSPRSYNSQIGVPLSLLNIEPFTQLAIIETGISCKKEMDKLEEIIKPNIVVFTPITREHDSGFSSHNEKVNEKGRLARNADFAICLDSEKELQEKLAEYPCKVETVNSSSDFISQCNTLAHAVASMLGINTGNKNDIQVVKTRLNVIEGVNNCKIIFDKFTQDIPSLRGALDFMRRQAGTDLSLTLILPTDTMLERPSDYVELFKEYEINRLILIGEKASSLTYKVVPKFETYKNVAEFMAKVSANDFSDEIILMRGEESESQDAIYSMLEAKQHETVLEVNLDAIISNFNFFRSKVRPTTGVICMLKAQGYGTGSVELARTLQNQGAAYLAVAVVDEGVELRRAGITMPLIVLNPRAQNHKMMFEYNLEPAVYSFEVLEQIIENARRYGISDFPIHIKLETGMRRLGFVENEAQRLADRLANSSEVTVKTMFSHLACADDPNEDDYTRHQFDTFIRICDIIAKPLKNSPLRHILNSTGIIRFPEMQLDFVRLGIGLYGVPTVFDGSEDDLRNVATLSSVVISLKHWSKGDTIGYNRRGRLERDTLVATIPIGYADGLDRHLGYGNASFLVNGHLCPTIGSICMDICMIDVTDANCKVNDRVEIFGETVTPIVLANQLGTIPYEILTSISPRVKRVYYRE